MMQKKPLQIVYYRNKNLQFQQNTQTNKVKNNGKMMSKQNYKNRSKVEAYCKQDGSLLSFYYCINYSKKDTNRNQLCYISSILYYSSNGIKHKINIKDIKYCHDLYQKLEQVFKIINKYNDEFLLFQYQSETKISKKDLSKNQKNFLINQRQQKQHQPKEINSTLILTQNFVYKKYKIKEFTWQKSKIQRKQISSSNKTKDLNTSKINYSGYQIRSNDLNASLMLMDDLYRIKVQYLQLLDDKQNKVKLLSKKTPIDYLTSNQIQIQAEENVLSKYAFHPPKIQNYKKSSNNRNTSSFQNEIQQQYQVSYKYEKVHKTFSIFNIPPRWYQPIRQIWSFLLINKFIKNQFLYIDFEQNGINVQKVTKTMKPLKILDISYSSELLEDRTLFYDNQNQNALPIFAKPKNIQPFCEWLHFQNYQSQIMNNFNKKNQNKFNNQLQQTLNNEAIRETTQNLNKKSISVFSAWLNHESDMNILYDGYGYWHKNQQSSYIYYKKSNGSQTNIFQSPQCQINETNYHVSSIPLVTRIRSKQKSQRQEIQQPARKMKSTLQAFVSYIEHNLKKGVILSNENQETKNISKTQYHLNSIQMSNSQPYTEQIQSIGIFRAYPNEMVIGKFVDKIIMNLNGKKQLIEVVDEMGQKCQINLGKLNQNLSKNQFQLYNSSNFNPLYGKYKTTPYSKYMQHVMYMKQFHQKIFYPSQWQAKKNLELQVRDLVQRNKIFRKITSLQNDFNSHNNSKNNSNQNRYANDNSNQNRYVNDNNKYKNQEQREY